MKSNISNENYIHECKLLQGDLFVYFIGHFLLYSAINMTNKVRLLKYLNL